MIDDCDYYIVIIGGRYGSVDSDGISFTQKEYEYAISKNIPIIGFVHNDPENIPVSKAEKDSKNKKKLDEFKKVVQGKLCKHWVTAKDLGGVVSRSMIQEIKRNPRSGWIKANLVNANAEKTIIALYKKIEDLELEQETRSNRNFNFASYFEDVKDLSQGDDIVTLKIIVTYGDWKKKNQLSETFGISWNRLTYLIFPKLINSIRDSTFKTVITKSIRELAISDKKFTEKPNFSLVLSDESFETVKIQLLSLGYIETYISTEDDPEEKVKRIRLTDFGEQLLVRQRALKREADNSVIK